MPRLAFLLVLPIILAAGCTAQTESPTARPGIPTIATATLRPTASSTLPPSPTRTPILAPVIDPLTVVGLDMLTTIPNSDTRALAFSPDNQRLAVASGNAGNFNVTIWNPVDGSLANVMGGHFSIVWDTAYSPDGRWIASVSAGNGNQRTLIQNAQSGSVVADLAGIEEPYCVAFSPDGSLLAVGGEKKFPFGRIWLFSTSDWSPVTTLGAYGQNVQDVVFTSDGTEVIGSGSDGTTRVWRLKDYQVVRTLFRQKQADRIAVSPSGDLLATTYCAKYESYGCSDGGVYIWRLPEGKVLTKFTDMAESLAFSPDGSLLAVGSGPAGLRIRIRETTNWVVLWESQNEGVSLAFSPDGRMLASADRDAVTVWGIH